MMAFGRQVGYDPSLSVYVSPHAFNCCCFFLLRIVQNFFILMKGGEKKEKNLFMFILIADGASRMRMCQEQQQYHSCNRRKNLNYMFHLFAVTFFPLTVCFRAKRVAKIHLVLFLCLLTEEEPFF